MNPSLHPRSAARHFHRPFVPLLFFTCLGCCLLATTSSFAQSKLKAKNFLNATQNRGDEKTYIIADHAEYELDSGWVTFSGHVAIRYQNLELRSDQIRYNQKTGDAQAKGKVILAGSDGSLWQGEALDINLKNEAGKVDHIDIYSKPFRVLADQGTLSTNKTYEIQNATLTTCTNETHRFHYQVKTKRVRFRPDRDITAWGAVPYLFGVPFFYFPYFWKDLNHHYGFRFEPGYRGSWGPFLLSSYKTPFYLDDNKERGRFFDSKTSVDYRHKRGFAYGERLGWGSKENAMGYFSAYYLEDEDLPNTVEDPERYRLRLNHSWNLTARDQLLLNALYVSDDLFMPNFFRDEHREMNQPDNYLSYTHIGDSYSAGLLGRIRLNDFYTQVERLPEAWFNLNPTELGESGIYIENNTQAALLNKEYDERYNPLPDPYKAFRADTATRLSVPLKFFGFLNVIPRAGYRATYYSKTLEQFLVTSTTETVSTNEYGDVETFVENNSTTGSREAGAEIRSLFELGTELSFKAYGLFEDREGNIWRHVAEPYANYTFIPEPNLRPAQLYQFDDIDELDKQHSVRLGLRNRWQVKPVGGKKAYQRIYIDLFADVNLDPESNQDRIESYNLDSRYTPNNWIRFDIEGRYLTALDDLDYAAFRLITWHQVFSSDFEFRYRPDDSSLLLADLTWHFNQSWSINAYERYEFETSQVEEVGTWLEHRWDCIAMRLYFSFEPGYGIQADGTQEKDDYKVSLLFWLTDFTPNHVTEDGHR